MGAPITQRAREAYKKIEDVKKKAQEYWESAKRVLDKDTRSGELFKLGVSGLMKLGEKALGTSLTKHPYFDYHKKHLEILVQALTASDTHHNAFAALNSAMQSADAASTMTKTLGIYTNRKGALKMEYVWLLEGNIRILRDYGANPALVKDQLTDTGNTIKSVGLNVSETMYAWRAKTCELYIDSIDLLVMVDLEHRATVAAMTRYNEKMKKLQDSTSNMDAVAGLALEKKRQEEWVWRELERQRHPSKNTPDPQAVVDPTGFAKRQRDKVEDTVKVLGAVCDLAMGDDFINPDTMNRKLNSL